MLDLGLYSNLHNVRWDRRSDQVPRWRRTLCSISFNQNLPLMKSTRYLKIVRASAWYDLLVTWPFATPWTFVWMYAQLAQLAQAGDLPGVIHPLDATQMLFANLLGSVVVVWSLARILEPSVRLGRLDGVVRALFTVWQLMAVQAGVSMIVLGFTGIEIIFSILQWWPVNRVTADISKVEPE